MRKRIFIKKLKQMEPFAHIPSSLRWRDFKMNSRETWNRYQVVERAKKVFYKNITIKYIKVSTLSRNQFHIKFIRKSPAKAFNLAKHSNELVHWTSDYFSRILPPGNDIYAKLPHK